MAEKLSVLSVLSRLGYAFNRRNFPSFCLKPFQVKCFEYLLKDKYIVVVLPTGFGKSLLRHQVRKSPWERGWSIEIFDRLKRERDK